MAVALACGLILIAAVGVSLPEAVSAFVDGAWGSGYAISASLNRAAVLGLVGLGFILANRANLTNVGGEGQIAIGGVAATAVCLYGGVAHLPQPLPFLIPMLLAACAGGLWGSVAGFLKVKAGTNEVISTLLLSFIGIWVLYGCVQSVSLLRQPMTNSATLPESLEIPIETQIPAVVNASGLSLHLGLAVFTVLAAIVAIVLNRSTFGLKLRAVGLNSTAAKRAGTPIGLYVILVMFLAGAFGGLAGSFMLQAEQLVLKARFSSGYGFDGLVVGLLARGSVKGVVASALLLGFLRSGGISMELTAGVPSAIVLIIQGLIIVTLAGATYWLSELQTGLTVEITYYGLLALFVGSSIRLAIAMMLGALGELVSERAGVLNLSVEGMMLLGAFAGAMASLATGSPLIGLICAVLAVLPVALLQAVLSISLHANQIVSGIGINIFVLGATTLAYREMLGNRSRIQIPGFGKWDPPLLGDIPVVGQAIFAQSWMVYLAFALAVAIWFVLSHTALGLKIHAAGAEPRALDKSGVSVVKVRYGTVLFAGAMSALGGAYMSLSDIQTFTEGMTNGVGYLAIVGVIFGNWKVGRTVFACLFFGAATALQFQLPAMGVDVPNALLIMLPYLMALLAVAGLVGRQTPPPGLTLPYFR